MKLLSASTGAVLVGLVFQTCLAMYSPLDTRFYQTDDALRFENADGVNRDVLPPFSAAFRDDDDDEDASRQGLGGIQIEDDGVFSEEDKAILLKELDKLTGSLDNIKVRNIDSQTFAMLYDVTDVEDVTSDPLLQGCSKGKCTFCYKIKSYTFCLTAGYDAKEIGLEIVLTVNGRQIFKKEISVANPPPVCFDNIPYVKKFLNLCLQVYNVNLKTKSACAKVVFALKIGPVKKKLSWNIGCFTVPILPTQAQAGRLSYV